MSSKLRKVLRYITIYGLSRTLFKAAGRSRAGVSMVRRSRKLKDIAVIGCGQFGLTTIGYFLTRRFGARIRSVFDIDATAAATARKILRADRVADSVTEDILNDDAVSYVYIASNHATHTDYAIRALEAQKTVYVEKPVAVTREQLAALDAATRAQGADGSTREGARLYCGYNRPFSKAIADLRHWTAEDVEGGLSLNCFVAGHQIPDDHWYRNPEEGTRICGNAGHWIDLFWHLLSRRDTPPNRLRITLGWADPDEFDDNFSLSIGTDQGDIFSLMLSARNEPFEGINETLNIQQGRVSAKIDDFRRMTLWQDARKISRRYWPKDVGHRAAILQPFQSAPRRPWEEVFQSTIITLTVSEMVRQRQVSREVVLADEIARLRANGA